MHRYAPPVLCLSRPTSPKSRATKEVPLQRRIFALLFPIAGVLLSQSAQAQTLVNANGTSELAPTGTFTQNADIATDSTILLAQNGGSITGVGDLTLNVSGSGTQENRALTATGTSLTGTSSLINMTTGQTVIDMRFISPTPSAHYRGAIAQLGGTVNLDNVTIFLGPGPGIGSPNRGVEAADPDSKLSAANTTINTTDADIGAFAFHGSALSLTGKTTITVTGSNGYGIASQTSSDGLATTLSETGTVISVTGDTNDVVAAYFKGATTTINSSTVTVTGSNDNPLIAYHGGVVNVTNSTVTVKSGASDTALVDAGSVLNVAGSTISGGVSGIAIIDDDHTLGPDTVTLTNHSTLTNLAGGNGEAAFKVVGSDVNITVTDSTVDSGVGVGVTQHTLLDVTQSVLSPAAQNNPENVTPPLLRPQTFLPT